MTLRLTPIRVFTLALALLALVALAACDSGAPPAATPIPSGASDKPLPIAATPLPPGTAATPTPRTPPTAPAAVLTGVPQQIPPAQTGVVQLPAPGQTGGPVNGTPITTPLGAAGEPPRMTKEDLLAHMQKGDVLVIDVRNPDFYAQKHIKGAINFPFEDLDKRYGELPKDRLVVAYCQ